ncbi:MAG TPA: hypothetical protein VKG25_17440 [Bryobacteraceae bacterium]|nr:hypothetical protein [Bryobacteraceae bacterium]
MNTLAWASLVYTFLCTFPGSYGIVSPGLDASWMFALNRLAGSSTYLFGRDVVFTYGPLGFLMVPEVDGNGATLIIAEVFWCLLHVSLFAVAAWRFRRQAAALMLFSAGYLTVAGLGIWLDNRLLFTLGAFALLSLESNATSIVFAAAAVALGFTGLLMKWSVGLSGLSIVAASWLILMKHGGSASRRILICGMFSAVLGIVAISVLMQSPANAWRWTRESMEVAAGYSAAMSFVGGLRQLFLAVGSGACLLALHFMLSRKSRYCLWMFAGFFFLALKGGFVRQDAHRMAYFAGVAMIPVVLLFAPPLLGRERWKAMGALVALGAMAVFAARDYKAPPLRLAATQDYLLMRPGISHIKNLVSIGLVIRDLRAAAASQLRPRVLPQAWQTRLDDPRATVSILPWELSVAAANRLHWQPAYVLQLYSAYTAELDKEVAEHLAGSGPEYLIVNYDAIDARNMFMDTPLTWRVVMNRYEVADTDLNAQRVLMVRKARGAGEELRELGTGRASMNGWVPVPEGTHLLYAPLQINFTVLGKLADILYQTPPLYIETVRRRGRIIRNRLISATAENGILINYPPGDQVDMEGLFSGEAADPVVRFRLVQPARSWRFQDRYSWRLLESSRTVEPMGAPPQPPSVPELVPAKIHGRKANLVIHASDPNGVRDLQVVQLLISGRLDGANACYLSYEIAGQRMLLVSDSGSGAAGYGHPGDAAALGNSRCQIQLEQTSATIEGNVLTIRLPIELKPIVAGEQHVYVFVMDREGLKKDWTERGVWQVK